MKLVQFGYAIGVAAALWSTCSIAAEPGSAYQTPVQLSSGKNLLCGVNEAPPAGAKAVLTQREQVQADVLATQHLRLLSGPTSPYPSDYTAPTVACVTAG
ncbi:hypothetical protein ACFSHT_39910 [Paraburkholderia silviterrae]|uniref:Uncharacterized protein n=1 Tax=Paraburkholderia silviterrae TaxID=2528715 RepID=A0A4R5M1X4_9BURK|nr:hypothetical protein [Paraburkholderia silviterrae]TDG19407.1 hypothetical protein EYW47_30955 [Paraburkholderia silviterrae]